MLSCNRAFHFNLRTNRSRGRESKRPKSSPFRALFTWNDSLAWYVLFESVNPTLVGLLQSETFEEFEVRTPFNHRNREQTTKYGLQKPVGHRWTLLAKSYWWSEGTNYVMMISTVFGRKSLVSFEVFMKGLLRRGINLEAQLKSNVYHKGFCM